MDYIILCLGKYDRLQSEFDQKNRRMKKRLESVLIDEAEYPFLKHFAETLTALKKRLHDSDQKQ